MITSRETPPRRRRLSAVWRPIASFILFLAGGVVLLRMDPFGFSRLTKHYSQDLLAVATGGFLSGRGGWRVRLKEGRAETAVVLLRDPDLAAFEEPWPPRYSFHARILKAIRANQPPRPLPFPWWMVQDRGSDFRENCPSTPAIPARILLEGTEEDDVAIEEILDGSVVFYGAYFHGAADAMNTPLHNDLPAVFLHATALDNLITLGPEALRHSEPMLPLLDVSLPDFLLLAVIGALFVVRRTSSRFETGWEGMMRRVRSRLGRVVLIAFGSQIGMLVLLAGLAAFFACYIGASEWVLGVNFLFAVTWTEVFTH